MQNASKLAAYRKVRNYICEQWALLENAGPDFGEVDTVQMGIAYHDILGILSKYKNEICDEKSGYFK